MTQKDDDTPRDETADRAAEEKAPGEAAASADPPRPANDREAAEAAEPSPWAEGDAAALTAELAETKDRLLRALAEVENVRRRAQRDREESSRYAIANFAREMVTVADNLRRALESVTPEARAASPAVENLVVGVQMTENAMLAAFEGVGIKPIEAVGKPFDHNYHEALFEVPDPSQPAGTVVQEVERGYVLRDRLLRPAKVGVAKGGPRPEAASAEAEAAGDANDARGSSTYERGADAQSQAGPSGGKVNETL